MSRRPRPVGSRNRGRQPELEFCVPGEPVSARTHDRSRLVAWRERIQGAAAANWPRGRKPINVAVELRITHYGERRVIDLDNMIKPIQDALEGIVYLNDRQVQEVTGSWRNIDGRYPLRFISPLVAAAFSQGREFVHIRVFLARDDEELN